MQDKPLEEVIEDFIRRVLTDEYPSAAELKAATTLAELVVPGVYDDLIAKSIGNGN